MTIDVDLWDHDAFQRQVHHELLAQLRETDPGVHWVDEGDEGPGYWAITRQAHLKEVNRQADLFSSNARGTQMHEPDFDNPMTQAMNQGLMIELDAPKHTRFRRIVSRGFTPRMIRLLEDYLQNRTDSIIDKVCEQGHAEFVEDLSSELPLQAIAEMVGENTTLRNLNLRWNGIQAVGANALGDAVERNKGLRMLDLSFNSFLLNTVAPSEANDQAKERLTLLAESHAQKKKKKIRPAEILLCN